MYLSPPTFSARRRRGLTFIELLIGLSITAVTCAILATLISATAVGTSTQNDGRRNLVRLESLKAVLQDEFVNARCILATGTNYIVYWTGDNYNAVTPVNGAVNFSELRLLEIDSSGNLKLYYANWPTGTTNATILANDSAYATTSDWYTSAASLKSGTYATSMTLATGATLLSATLDNASPSAARTIWVRVDVTDNSVARQAVLAVTLANPSAPW